MKFIILLDCQRKFFDETVDSLKDKNATFIDTRELEEDAEYALLVGVINRSKTSDGITVARFSGREYIARELGDTSDETIVALSSNKNSPYYVEDMKGTFLEILNLF